MPVLTAQRAATVASVGTLALACASGCGEDTSSPASAPSSVAADGEALARGAGPAQRRAAFRRARHACASAPAPRLLERYRARAQRWRGAGNALSRRMAVQAERLPQKARRGPGAVPVVAGLYAATAPAAERAPAVAGCSAGLTQRMAAAGER